MIVNLTDWITKRRTSKADTRTDLEVANAALTDAEARYAHEPTVAGYNQIMEARARVDQAEIIERNRREQERQKSEREAEEALAAKHRELDEHVATAKCLSKALAPLIERIVTFDRECVTIQAEMMKLLDAQNRAAASGKILAKDLGVAESTMLQSPMYRRNVLTMIQIALQNAAKAENRQPVLPGLFE